jgi:DNA end-binding protein Ku
MPARATSSATISFGLVSIPIKVYAATRPQSVHFNMLHATDKARLKQQYLCSSCGEVVARDETVKGYEYSRGQFVVFTPEELQSLEKHSDKTIEIEEFIPITKVDPIYFEKSQLLGPDKGGHKAYALLRRAMEEKGRVALGRFATRGSQQLVLIRPTAEGLLLHGLYYADEVRSFDDVETGDDAQIKEGELELAEQLIDQLTNESFEPKKYEDEYRQAVLGMVDRKVAGEEVVAAPAAEEREQIIDLVAALKKSLADKGEGAAAARKPAKRAQAKQKPASKAAAKKR